MDRPTDHPTVRWFLYTPFKLCLAGVINMERTGVELKHKLAKRCQCEQPLWTHTAAQDLQPINLAVLNFYIFCIELSSIPFHSESVCVHVYVTSKLSAWVCSLHICIFYADPWYLVYQGGWQAQTSWRRSWDIRGIQDQEMAGDHLASGCTISATKSKDMIGLLIMCD